MDEALREKITKTITEKIRPGLQADGGDIELVEITDDGTVKLRLKGSCVGCPFAAMTLAVGVERTLKQAVPEVKKVLAVD
ncbi:MAG: NifU family protein [bacterium]|nr:NifU family protein [candidate division WOR-3 bacterium]